MNKMRPIPEMITGLRALAGLEVLRHHAALLNDAANYIEGATESLREHMQMLQAMRVKLEQVRPLMEKAIEELEAVMIKGCEEEELPAPSATCCAGGSRGRQSLPASAIGGLWNDRTSKRRSRTA
jgi:hypothetical protein